MPLVQQCLKSKSSKSINFLILFTISQEPILKMNYKNYWYTQQLANVAPIALQR